MNITEVNDGQFALSRDEKVAGVGVSVEEAGVEELDEETLNTDRDQSVDHCGGGGGQLGALYPLGDQDLHELFI